jgi:hypothetical protein
MVLRWCEPALVDAVRAAEVPFTEDQVVAACPCSLSGAAPAAPARMDFDPDATTHIQAGLRMPWSNLMADLRARVMMSRITLTGVPATDPQAVPASIPPSYANQYEFDFSSNTVTWFRGKWLAVTAALTTEAVALGEAGETPLPLKQAMLTWCDDVLVDRYETADTARQLAQDIRQGFRHPAHERRYAGASTFDLHLIEPWAERLEPARVALQTDFAARIASGEIELTGSQTEPALAADRTSLSPAWAGRMKFDWRNGTVQVGGVRFVDVSGVRRATPTAPETGSGGESRRGGRPSFPMEEMVEIARRRGSRESTNKGAASALLDEFKVQFPQRRAPSHRTVVDHVAEIYRGAALKART